MTTYTIVIPVYKNEESIRSLVDELEELDASLKGDLEVIFVVDGSPDRSGDLLLQSNHEFCSTIVFHSRNFGSFVAIRTGMEHASGDFLAAMAADLQEPPELILEFFALLSSDSADVVFGQRVGRQDPMVTRIFSKLFWDAYRRFVLRDIPRGGVDVFACNRQVLESVLAIEESNSSLVAQLFWVGFRRRFVPYVRRQRQHGKSAWSVGRRFRYLMDSMFSYSDLPILVVLWIGLGGCVMSFLFGTVTLTARFLGFIEVPGYTTLAILTVFFGSALLAVQGILGCYLWRAVENTKRRPLRVISRTVSPTDKRDEE